MEPVTVVSRESWGALPAKAALPALEIPLPNVVVHWSTGTDPCNSTDECIKAVQNLQKSHMEEKGLDDIAYNFLIGGDGKAYHGRGWEGAPHPLAYEQCEPTKRIDIAHIGRDWDRATIPFEMLKAALQVLNAGVDSKLLIEEYDVQEDPIELIEESDGEENF